MRILVTTTSVNNRPFVVLWTTLLSLLFLTNLSQADDSSEDEVTGPTIAGDISGAVSANFQVTMPSQLGPWDYVIFNVSTPYLSTLSISNYIMISDGAMNTALTYSHDSDFSWVYVNTNYMPSDSDVLIFDVDDSATGAEITGIFEVSVHVTMKKTGVTDPVEWDLSSEVYNPAYYTVTSSTSTSTSTTRTSTSFDKPVMTGQMNYPTGAHFTVQVGPSEPTYSCVIYDIYASDADAFVLSDTSMYVDYNLESSSDYQLTQNTSDHASVEYEGQPSIEQRVEFDLTLKKNNYDAGVGAMAIVQVVYDDQVTSSYTLSASPGTAYVNRASSATAVPSVSVVQSALPTSVSFAVEIDASLGPWEHLDYELSVVDQGTYFQNVELDVDSNQVYNDITVVNSLQSLSVKYDINPLNSEVLNFDVVSDDAQFAGVIGVTGFAVLERWNPD
ncbi:hypothetical protein WICPIJ_001878, partial [Wickerhamomyces pijperi]